MVKDETTWQVFKKIEKTKKKLICKNCKHPIIFSRGWWFHYNKVSNLIDFYSDGCKICNCEKPEPKDEEDRRVKNGM